MTPGRSATWSHGLEGSALRLAATDHSPLRGLAGPGTGKTFALIRRVARLLEDGADPKRILVCTFTRTAAADLVKALRELGLRGAENVVAGTIHSFCFHLLSRKAILELTGRVPRPLLKFEERFLLEDLAHCAQGGVRVLERRLEAFNAAWARLQCDEPGWPLDPADRSFQDALLGWLRFHEAMLIGELVPQTLQYLRENPACDERHLFDHTLVDEYQDLNRAEQVLLDLLAGDGTLTIVGDEDQSIYSFKHAHPEGIVEFPKHHPETEDVPLEECRRCPTRVVELANSLIKHNSRRTQLTLRPQDGNPEGEVLIVQWPSMQDEISGIAQFIQQRVNSGSVSPGSVLVLAPRRQFGYGIRDELQRLGLPAHSFFHEEALEGNPKNLDDSRAQQAFELLTLLAEPDDRVALRCWCGFGSSSLRSTAWVRLRKHCEMRGVSPREALQQLVAGRLRIPYTNDFIECFRCLETDLKRLSGLRGDELLDALFPGGQEWAEPFRSIASGIGQADYDAATLREVLRIGITQPELPTDVDYIRVMSLHKSKGLTADLVVVVGCIQGLIPFIADDLSPAERDRALEEQRRLFYVAITRTRQTLVLSSTVRIPRDFARRMQVPFRGGGPDWVNTIASRFLAELGRTRPRSVTGAEILDGEQH